MPSSISNSDTAVAPLLREAPRPGLRLTASDRPGEAQPVPERDIPAQPWPRIALATLLATLLLCGAWEGFMRAQELVLDDSGYSVSAWAEQRRRIDTEAGGQGVVAIVGDSRILYDTNLDWFQRLTGKRPIQLALPGTNALPFLEDLSTDPKFDGLLIVGISDTSYFRTRIGLMEKALGVARWESPASRMSYRILHFLRHYLVMLDQDYRLSVLLQRMDHGLRAGVDSPYEQPWKIGNILKDRQTVLWARLEHDDYLREHARHAWNDFAGPPVSAAVIADTIARTSAAVARIRARGGDVIFVRPPSMPRLRVNEEKRIPKTRGWEALLAAAKVRGIHFDDLPAAQGLTLPEWSHLSPNCARVFTDAYVRRLSAVLPEYGLVGDAPPPLSRADCM